MVYFQTKNHNLGKFWRALEWIFSYILWSFGKVVIISHHLGILCQEKSGNPGYVVQKVVRQKQFR
jgi:hypothetical protein